MGKLSLDQLVLLVKDIPVLPDRINKILKLTEDPDSTVQDIEHEILKDQSLTTKVLRLANSVHYGYPRKIGTITEATILLGFQAIRSITLASSVNQLLVQELPGYGLQKYDLWKQSQSCAIIARYIAKKVKFNKPEQAYIASLLRDIGKVILNHYVAQQYQQIIKKVENENKPFIEAEQEILGFHHGEVGAKVGEKWNFPPDLVEAIAYHHSPEKATINPKLTSITHIADAIVMMMGIGLGADGLAYLLSDFAIQTLNIDETQLQVFISECLDLVSDIENFSNI
jgi:putative nucleotidyltransferase with HDIG domain